jgi:site-specific recombinase XerD
MQLIEDIDHLQAERQRYVDRMLAPNTALGYHYDLAQFHRWCERFGRIALPASTETVCLFLTHQLARGNKVTTALRRMFAIVREHRDRNVAMPDIRELRNLLAGAQRLRAERPRQMVPITVRQLRAISVALAREGTAAALRDRALMVVGFASALRRSNLAALTTEDIEFCRQGVIVTVRREKQDQEARGRLIGLPRGKHPHSCPVRALRAWLRVRGDAFGPLFWRIDKPGLPLSGENVCRIVKLGVARIGLDPTDYGAHSLRSGFVTAAGARNIPPLVIAAHTGHRSLDMLRLYFRRSELWRANPCAALGL